MTDDCKGVVTFAGLVVVVLVDEAANSGSSLGVSSCSWVWCCCYLNVVDVLG